MNSCFDFCSSFNNGGKPILWSLPQATTMTNLFLGCKSLDVPITLLRLDNITNVSNMLGGCVQFKSALMMEVPRVRVFNVQNMLRGTAVDKHEEAVTYMRNDCQSKGIPFIPDAQTATGLDFVRFLKVYNTTYVPLLQRIFQPDPQFGLFYHDDDDDDQNRRAHKKIKTS